MPVTTTRQAAAQPLLLAAVTRGCRGLLRPVAAVLLIMLAPAWTGIGVDAAASAAAGRTVARADAGDTRQSGNSAQQAGGGTDSAAGDEPRPAASTGNKAGARKPDAQAGSAADGGDDAGVVPSSGPKTPLPEGNADISQLLRLWGVFGAEVEASCASLHVGDLHCLSEQGTLATLEHFNRPAIVLLAYDGRRQRVLISQLGEQKATLVGAERARRISRKRLARLWTGEFRMIWRAHTGAVLIHNGMSGDAVLWLRQRLRLAAGKDSADKPGSKSPVFDDELESRVRNFQLMHGLQPDGIAGPRTQIILNGIAATPGVPTLEPKPDEEG